MDNKFEQKLEEYSESLRLDGASQKRVWNKIIANLHNVGPEAHRKGSWFDDLVFTLTNMRNLFKKRNMAILVPFFMAFSCFILDGVPLFVKQANNETTTSDKVVQAPTNKMESDSHFAYEENISITDRQSELTSYSNRIESLKKEIAELETQYEGAQDEAERNRIENEISGIEKKITSFEEDLADVESTTDWSSVEIRLTHSQEGKEKIGSTWDEVTDAVSSIVVFWVQAFMWTLVPLLFCTPVFVIVLIGTWILVKVLRRK